LQSLWDECAEFRDFGNKGIAGKLSGLKNKYAMWINVIEKQGQAKSAGVGAKPESAKKGKKK
jgi:hypothetical protein